MNACTVPPKYYFDYSSPYVWAGLGIASSTLSSAVGSALAPQSSGKGLLALSGALGSSAIGAGAIALHLAIPPPGEVALGARIFVFTFCASVLGAYVGALIIRRVDKGICLSPDEAMGANLLGASSIIGSVSLAATLSLITASMFMGD